RRFGPRQSNTPYNPPAGGRLPPLPGPTRITKPMSRAPARALQGSGTGAVRAQGGLVPPLSDVREVSARIAADVAAIAFREKLATVPQPPDLLAWVKASMYQPRYEATAP